MATQLLLIAAFVTSMILMSLNYKKRKKRVMFIAGSSIENAIAPGNYITHLSELLKKENLDDKYELLTTTIASESIDEVFEKIEVTVLDKGPDVVIVNFTVADMAQWLTPDKKRFDAFYKAIIRRFLEAGIRIIICMPKLNEQDEVIERGINLTSYVLFIKDVAVRNELPVIDLHQIYSLPNNEHSVQYLIALEIWKKLKNI
jgi:hypothetical protein